MRVSVSQKLYYTLLKLFICLQTFFVFLFHLKYFRCLDAVLFQFISKSGLDQPYNLTRDALKNSFRYNLRMMEQEGSEKRAPVL